MNKLLEYINLKITIISILKILRLYIISEKISYNIILGKL